VQEHRIISKPISLSAASSLPDVTAQHFLQFSKVVQTPLDNGFRRMASMCPLAAITVKPVTLHVVNHTADNRAKYQSIHDLDVSLALLKY
jgi:hypothetical protein